MNLTSYAGLAVCLVNTAIRADGEADPLGSADCFRALVADHPSLAGMVTRQDLDSLRLLRAELAAVFASALAGDEGAAMARLNALLIQHPVHPVLVSHDDERWHLHLAEVGSVADRYAAGAITGLAMFAAQYGTSRLEICAIVSCDRVFIDSSPNRSRRYCAEHCAARANVRAIRTPERAPGNRSAAPAAS
ncbi:MAG: CGNR zinc finger domain-containing protein [Streptosporangiaceae bacterium]